MRSALSVRIGLVALSGGLAGLLAGCPDYTCVDYQNCIPDGGGTDAGGDAAHTDAKSDGPVTSHDGGAHDGASDGGVDGRPSEASTDGGVDAPRDVFTCDPMKGPSEQ